MTEKAERITLTELAGKKLKPKVVAAIEGIEVVPAKGKEPSEKEAIEKPPPQRPNWLPPF